MLKFLLVNFGATRPPIPTICIGHPGASHSGQLNIIFKVYRVRVQCTRSQSMKAIYNPFIAENRLFLNFNIWL